MSVFIFLMSLKSSPRVMQRTPFCLYSFISSVLLDNNRFFVVPSAHSRQLEVSPCSWLIQWAEKLCVQKTHARSSQWYFARRIFPILQRPDLAGAPPCAIFSSLPGVYDSVLLLPLKVFPFFRKKKPFVLTGYDRFLLSDFSIGRVVKMYRRFVQKKSEIMPPLQRCSTNERIIRCIKLWCHRNVSRTVLSRMTLQACKSDSYLPRWNQLSLR